MHVLHVTDVYFPRVNGVSTSIRSFRADLAAAGVETTLVAPAYGGASAPDDDAGIVRVPSARVPRDPEDRRMHWGSLEAQLAGMAARGVDLVHIQTPFLAHYAGLRAARRLGVPAIATCHTLFEEYLHHYVPALPRPWGRRLARTLTRSQAAGLAALVSPSGPMRDRLLEYGVDVPIHVLPTGLPADRLRRGTGARFRERHGIGAERPLLLYVGRVAHEKNIDFLLRVHARVLRERPDALLLIAGEGPAREPLARLARQAGIADSVRFVGYLERRTELPACYCAADVFVFASKTETQGLVLLEAMALGVPVVALAEMGTQDVLKEGAGCRIAPDDVAGFARTVLPLLADREAARALGAAGRPYAAGWSEGRMADAVIGLYRQLCQEALQRAA